jgi:hypothetical protein
MGFMGAANMIVVKVELHSAITRQVKEIARMQICNDGSGTLTKGHYYGSTYIGRSKEALDRMMPLKSGYIHGFPRQALHVWNLVARMLREMGYTK